MARTYLDIGCSPASEECVQVSNEHDYYAAMMAECERFKEMLIAKFPNCNKVELDVKTFPHEFGTYAQVVAYYSEYDVEAEAQAIFIQDNMPEYWENTEILLYEKEKLFTVWVGGVEVNDTILTEEEADDIVEHYKSLGYDDIVKQEVKEDISEQEVKDE